MSAPFHLPPLAPRIERREVRIISNPFAEEAEPMSLRARAAWIVTFAGFSWIAVVVLAKAVFG